MKLHPKVTVAMIINAVERRMTTLDNPGFCMACGAEAHGVEPDARKVECEACGEHQVYGADDLAIEVM